MKKYGMVTNKEYESNPSISKGRWVRLYMKDIQTDSKIAAYILALAIKVLFIFILVGAWHTNLFHAASKNIYQF